LEEIKMVKNPKKIRNEYEYLRKKEYFNKYTMKRGWSIPVQVYLQVKDRKNWEEGLTSKQLQKRVKSSINNFRYRNELKPKKISLGSVYKAIGELNLFCDHIYIRSDFRFRRCCPKCDDNFHYEPLETNCLKCNAELEIKKEHRYFCPYEGEDIEKEKRKLLGHMFRMNCKKKGLESFEEEELKHIKEVEGLKQEINDNIPTNKVDEEGRVR